MRTGLTKVGLPGATLGLQKEDPTIAELLNLQQERVHEAIPSPKADYIDRLPVKNAIIDCELVACDETGMPCLSIDILSCKEFRAVARVGDMAD